MKKLLFSLYIIFLISFTVFSYIFIDPNFLYLKNLYSGLAFQNRLQTTILYVLAIFLFFIFYFFFLILVHRKFIDFKELKWLVFLTVSILFFSYPAMLSYDIFNYIATSKVLFFYHENPYIIMPIEFAGDPLLSFTHAANKIALYGTSWILLTAMPYIAGFGNFLIILFNFKLFIAIFYFFTLFIIWKLAKDKVSVCLFGLNPLVIIETLVSSHNDIVMMFFALSSFFFLMRKKLGFAILFFILSIFIKYTTILLAPVFVYAFWKIIRKKSLDWEKIFYFSALSMIVAFLLSPFREEIYPWYAIWFMPFVALAYRNKILPKISIALSFGLMLRYIPFMLLGTHFSPTPIIKTLVTFIPVIIVFIYIVATHFLSFWLVQNSQTQKRRFWSRLRSPE